MTKLSASTNATLGSKRRTLNAKALEALDRLRTIVDENLGMQPVLEWDELLSLVENALREQGARLVAMRAFAPGNWTGLTPIPCAACGADARGSGYALHRDGAFVGPEVEICGACGASERPTVEELWERIAQRRRDHRADQAAAKREAVPAEPERKRVQPGRSYYKPVAWRENGKNRIRVNGRWFLADCEAVELTREDLIKMTDGEDAEDDGRYAIRVQRPTVDGRSTGMFIAAEYVARDGDSFTIEHAPFSGKPET